MELLWQPEIIGVGNKTQFGLLFMDSSQSVVNGVNYDFKVTDSNGTIIRESNDQRALDGTGVQTVNFTKPGPIHLMLRIDAVEGQNIGDFVESTDFNLIVGK